MIAQVPASPLAARLDACGPAGVIVDIRPGVQVYVTVRWNAHDGWRALEFHAFDNASLSCVEEESAGARAEEVVREAMAKQPASARPAAAQAETPASGLVEAADLLLRAIDDGRLTRLRDSIEARVAWRADLERLRNALADEKKLVVLRRKAVEMVRSDEGVAVVLSWHTTQAVREWAAAEMESYR